MGIFRGKNIFFEKLKLIHLFISPYFIFLKIEKQLREDFKYFESDYGIKIKKRSLNIVKNFKENFFTILILSVLEKSDVTQKKIIKYGKIMLCLRTVVSCINKEIKLEEQGIFYLDNFDNEVISDTMLLIATQSIIKKNLISLGSEKEEKILKHILDKIIKPEESEILKNRFTYSDYPKPDYILKKIHKQLGAELFQYFLIAPIFLEDKKNLKKLKEFNKGIFQITMSLQALKDLWSMADDYNFARINLEISNLIYMGNSEDYTGLIVNSKDLRKKYKEFYVIRVNNNIQDMLKGFEKFIKAGYPIDKKDVLLLIKTIFYFKGFSNFWEISSYKGLLDK